MKTQKFSQSRKVRTVRMRNHTLMRSKRNRTQRKRQNSVMPFVVLILFVLTGSAYWLTTASNKPDSVTDSDQMLKIIHETPNAEVFSMEEGGSSTSQTEAWQSEDSSVPEVFQLEEETTSETVDIKKNDP